MFTVLCVSLFVLLAAGLPVEHSNIKRYKNPLTHGGVGKKLVLSICIFVASLMVLSIIFFVIRKFRPEADAPEDNHPLVKMAHREGTPGTRGGQPIGDVVGDISYYHTKVWQERNNGQRKNPAVTQPVVLTPPAPVALPRREREDEPLPGVPEVESWHDSVEESVQNGAALRRTPAVRRNRKKRLSSQPGATCWVRRKR